MQLGVDRDLYAIQIDKWTTDDDDFTSVQIAHELIILEREHLKRTGSATSSVLAARALLARNGYTVNDAASSSSAAPHPTPSPNEAAVRCSYCSSMTKSLFENLLSEEARPSI